MRSLRFRLPAVFIVGLVVAGVVTALLATRLFQEVTEDDSLATLRRQAAGLAQVYADQAIRGVEEGRPAPRFAAPLLEQATGTRLYYVGAEIFPGQISGLRRLDRDALDWQAVEDGRVQTFELDPPDGDRSFLAVAQPLELGGEVFGALVVARPRAELRERWLDLLGRLGLALVAGLAVATALAWWLSRRLTEPVLALSRAADDVARGRYETQLPPGGRRDEIGHLAERFQEMTERLAESERRERHFLMSVSHELRTPLTAIRGHIEALREGLADDPEARDASLDVIGAQADRLSRLVGDLIDLARLDAHRFTLEREEVELRRLLEQAYQSFSEQARQREIDYEQAFDADPILTTDGDRVLQVVTNLLDNAFSWTPDGGRIVLGLSSANGIARISVSDSGPGIDARERERIFRPFWTGDRAGIGLGLAIASELAQALGGRLSLESEPGKGSRFELRLPAPETPATRALGERLRGRAARRRAGAGRHE